MVSAVRWPAVSSVLSVISVLSVGPATAQVESAKVDSFIAAAIKEREELVARKFAEFRFRFETSADAKAPEKGATVVFRRLPA